MTHQTSGGCNCGAVRFSTAAPLRDVIFCHCSQCRKQTGHYYAATSVSDEADLAIEGRENITWYTASEFARRGFCSRCGSALFWKPVGHRHIAILAGALDDGTPLRAAMHIFVTDKGCYYDLADGLPQYPADAPGIAVAVQPG